MGRAQLEPGAGRPRTATPNDNAVNQLNDILDAQEITVITVNNTAEFARVGYMNLVTKSGTNEFHGQAAYWNQNSALGARRFIDDSKTKVLIHTISGSVAGPAIKNKLFFYASANILYIPSKSFYLRDVPTDADAQRGFFTTAGAEEPDRNQGSSQWRSRSRTMLFPPTGLARCRRR